MIDARIPLANNTTPRRSYSPDQLATLATLQQQPAMNQQRMENDNARLDIARQELEQRRTEAESRAKLQGQQYEMNSMQIEAQKRAADSARRIQQVLAENEGDVEKSIPGIRLIDPMAADTFMKHLDDTRKSRLATDTSAAGLQAKRAGMLANGTAAILNEADPAKRAAMYGTTRNALIASGQFKAEDLPEALPDEPTMRAWVGQAMSPEAQATLPSKVAGNDGLTPYQRAQIGARNQTAAETARHNREMETRQNAGATDIMKVLKTIRAEEMELEKEEAKLAARRDEIGNVTKTGKSVHKGKSYEITPEERAKLDSEYQGLDTRYKQVQTRKQQLAERRQGLQAGTLSGVAAGTPRPQSAAAALPAPAVQSLREGVVTSFRNGQKWTLRGGQAVRVQ